MSTVFMTDVSEDALAAALLDALQKETRAGALNQVERRQLVYTTVLSLREHAGWNQQDAVGIAKQLEVLYLEFRDIDRSFGEAPDIRRIEAAIWTLINRGIIYPRFNITKQAKPVDPSDPPWMIQFLVLTEVGRRLLQEDRAHPYRPDFVEKVLGDCTDLPDEASARLEDAHDCWRNNLLRAGVVMLGLAYEQVANEMFDSCGVLAKLGHNQQLQNRCRRGNAKAILEGLREALTISAQPKQPAEADTLAVNVADDIRQHRNNAAHDWSRTFSDRAQVEDLLILGGRKLPEFWDIRQRT